MVKQTVQCKHPSLWRMYLLFVFRCCWFLCRSQSDAFLLSSSLSSSTLTTSASSCRQVVAVSKTVCRASTTTAISTPSTTVSESPISDDNAQDDDDDDELVVVPPNGCFRETVVGQEVSVTTMNVLAPSYHVLGEPVEEQAILAQNDRESRYPQAISMAKRSNADILCLQEVEGGDAQLEELLGSILARNEPNSEIRGYDAFVFSPLLPNRPQDVVGLCVAWRSDRHRLVSCETFRRGMVIQLAEISTGATVAIANLHLPAKPSAIEGRLRAMASAIRRMQTCEAVSSRQKSALDGLAVVVGDFNCDHKSPAVKLLKSGYSTYGTIKDRNYKAKISKRVAANMRHVFRFRDVYDGELRFEIAPVTVSLHGRGPGIMDHILFSGSGDPSRKSVSSLVKKKKNPTSQTRRQARRERGISRQSSTTSTSQSFSIQRDNRSRVFVSSVLSTVAVDDTERLELIESGLPRESEGFYSDHLPVGAIFSSETLEPQEVKEPPEQTSSDDESDHAETRRNSRGSVNTKRQAYNKSLSDRRRHNRVLRAVAEWLLEKGATEMIRDVPLYKWKWLAKSTVKLSKKMRAPDLCCVVGSTLVVIEVTISQNQAEEMYLNKTRKYVDVFEALAQSKSVINAGLGVAPSTMAIVLDEEGTLFEESQKDLLLLIEHASVANVDIEYDNLTRQLAEIVLHSN